MRVGRHTTAVALVALHVALVHGVHGHIRHIVARHVRVSAHAAATRGGDVLARGVLRRFDLIAAVDAVVVAGSGFWGVKAGLFDEIWLAKMDFDGS